MIPILNRAEGSLSLCGWTCRGTALPPGGLLQHHFGKPHLGHAAWYDAL